MTTDPTGHERDMGCCHAGYDCRPGHAYPRDSVPCAGSPRALTQIRMLAYMQRQLSANRDETSAGARVLLPPVVTGSDGRYIEFRRRAQSSVRARGSRGRLLLLTGAWAVVRCVARVCGL